MYIVVVAAAVLDVVAWAAFRIDKRRAKRGRRRISERALLGLAAAGGVGAVIGMYGHRERHKTRKVRFVVVAAVAALAQLGVLARLVAG